MTIEIPAGLSASDQAEIERLLTLVGTDDPTLDQMWQCMDAVWDQLGCDNRSIDGGKLERYYGHPVWLLNGLFVEQHALSLENREIFSDWFSAKPPGRMADFGGGFGTFARMVARKYPSANVEVIDPFAHPFALAQAVEFENVAYKKELSGTYDAIVAMDVFEHVPDPLGLLHRTAQHVRRGGVYLTANCFYPVIKCHLPRTFHFRQSWKTALRALELRHVEDVCYGNVFLKVGDGSLSAARAVEFASRFSWPIKEWSRRARFHLGLRTRLRNALARLAH